MPPTKPEKYVPTGQGILIMLTTAFMVILTGALFSATYERGCTPDATGKAICTDKFEWKGWAGIPLQPLAAAIGIGLGTYGAVKAGKLPKMLEQFSGEALSETQPPN